MKKPLKIFLSFILAISMIATNMIGYSNLYVYAASYTSLSKYMPYTDKANMKSFKSLDGEYHGARIEKGTGVGDTGAIIPGKLYGDDYRYQIEKTSSSTSKITQGDRIQASKTDLANLQKNLDYGYFRSDSRDDWYIFKLDEATKSNGSYIKVQYDNYRIYDPDTHEYKKIRIDVSVVDYVASPMTKIYNHYSKPVISISKTCNGFATFAVRNVSNIKLRYKFYDENGNNIKIKSALTFYDTDLGQAISFEDTKTKYFAYLKDVSSSNNDSGDAHDTTKLLYGYEKLNGENWHVVQGYLPNLSEATVEPRNDKPTGVDNCASILVGFEAKSYDMIFTSGQHTDDYDKDRNPTTWAPPLGYDSYYGTRSIADDLIPAGPLEFAKIVTDANKQEFRDSDPTDSSTDTTIAGIGKTTEEKTEEPDTGDPYKYDGETKYKRNQLASPTGKYTYWLILKESPYMYSDERTDYKTLVFKDVLDSCLTVEDYALLTFPMVSGSSTYNYPIKGKGDTIMSTASGTNTSYVTYKKADNEFVVNMKKVPSDKILFKGKGGFLVLKIVVSPSSQEALENHSSHVKRTDAGGHRYVDILNSASVKYALRRDGTKISTLKSNTTRTRVPLIYTHDLVVKKKTDAISGQTAPDEKFTFTVTLDESAADDTDKDYKWQILNADGTNKSGSKNKGKVGASGNRSATISIKDGESFVIRELDKKVKYTIVEAGTDEWKPKYHVQKGSAVIDNSDDKTGTVGNSLSTGKRTIDTDNNNNTIQYLFTNTYTHYDHDITVRKNVTSGDTNQLFKFTFKMSNAQKNYTYNVYDASGASVKNGKVGADTPSITVSIKHDEKFVVHDVDNQVKFNVTEAGVKYWTPSYNITEGLAVIGNPETMKEGTKGANLATDTYTLNEVSQAGVTIVYSNAYDAPVADLNIKKIISGNAAGSSDTFRFTITLEGLVPETQYTVNGTIASVTTGTKDDSTHFTSDASGEAVVLADLGHNETFTIKDIPLMTAKYKISESTTANGTSGYIPSYTATGSMTSKSDTGTEDSDLETPLETLGDSGASYTFTNTKSEIVKILEITKKITGSSLTAEDNTRDFEFSVAFTGLKKNRTYTYTINGSQAGTFNSNASGAANVTVSIKPNEVLRFPDLHQGCKYVITESANEEFVPSYTATGSASVSTKKTGQLGEALSSAEETLTEKATFTFTNDKTDPLADLSITKKLSGDHSDVLNYDGSLEANKFSFSVAFTGLRASTTYTYKIGSGADQTFTSNASGSATVNVRLAKDQTVTFKDLRQTAKYTITEDIENDSNKTGWIPSYTATGSASKKSDLGTIDTNLSSANETLGAGAAFTFTNTKNAVQKANLSIKKTLSGPGYNKNHRFSYTVEFTGLKQNGTYDYITTEGTSSTFTADNSGEAEVTFTLGKDEKITFLNIEETAEYQITEAAYQHYKPSFTATGDAVTTSGEANTGESLSTPEEVLGEGSDYTFDNYRSTPKVSDLSITKKIGGNLANNNHEFEFTVDFEDLIPQAEYVYEINGTTNSDYKVTADSAGKAQLTVMLGKNDEIVIRDLPKTSKYTITDNSRAGYIASYTAHSDDNSLLEADERESGKGEELSTPKETLNDGVDYVFTNEKNSEPTGLLSIQKQTEGNNTDPDDEFEFTITLENLDESTSYTYYVAGVQKSVTSNAQGKATVTESIKHNEEIRFSDSANSNTGTLPVTARYTITEEGTSGYKPSFNATGSPVVKNGTASKGEDLSSQKEVLGESAAFIFTNVNNNTPTADIKITKRLLGDGCDPSDRFQFDVEITGLVSGEEYEYVYSNGTSGTFTYRTSGDTGIPAITLGKDEYVIFKDVPTNAFCTVTEESVTGYSIRYTAYSSGETLFDVEVSDGNTYNAPHPTVNNGLEYVITNSKWKPPVYHDVEIEKAVTGEAGDKEKEFDFTFLLSNNYNDRVENTAAGGEIIDTETGETVKVISSEDAKKSGDLWKQSFTLSDGQKAVFHGILSDAKFRVIEDNEDYDPSITVLDDDATYYATRTVSARDHMEIILKDSLERPVENAEVRFGGKSAYTDASGKAVINFASDTGSIKLYGATENVEFTSSDPVELTFPARGEIINGNKTEYIEVPDEEETDLSIFVMNRKEEVPPMNMLNVFKNATDGSSGPFGFLAHFTDLEPSSTYTYVTEGENSYGISLEGTKITISDETTGNGLPGITLVLKRPDGETREVRTDSNGQFDYTKLGKWIGDPEDFELDVLWLGQTSKLKKGGNETSSVLLDGPSLRAALVSLAGDAGNILWIEKGSFLPASGYVEIQSEGEPVYAWYDSEIIWIYSEADKIYLNPVSRGAFKDLPNLISVEGLDDLSGKKVVDASEMFKNDADFIYEDDILDWMIPKSADITDIFKGCDSMNYEDDVIYYWWNN